MWTARYKEELTLPQILQGKITVNWLKQSLALTGNVWIRLTHLTPSGGRHFFPGTGIQQSAQITSTPGLKELTLEWQTICNK